MFGNMRGVALFLASLLIVGLAGCKEQTEAEMPSTGGAQAPATAGPPGGETERAAPPKADPATVALLERAGDQALATLLFRPARWDSAHSTLKPFL